MVFMTAKVDIKKILIAAAAVVAVIVVLVMLFGGSGDAEPTAAATVFPTLGSNAFGMM